jgi:hypothetical protein
MQTQSQGKMLNDLLESSEGNLVFCSPWASQRGLERRLDRFTSDLAERVARKCGVSKKKLRDRFDGGFIAQLADDIFDRRLYDVAEDFFHAGFDFCLDLQKAQKAAAEGDMGALRPFIPTSLSKQFGDRKYEDEEED